MNVQIVPQVSVLMETIELLYKFVNNQTLDNIRRNFALRHGKNLDEPAQKHYDAIFAALGTILDEGTRGLDRCDLRLQYYFRSLQPDCGRDWACLAQVILCSFYDGETFGFEDSVEECRRNHDKLAADGWSSVKLIGIDRAGLSFVPRTAEEDAQPLLRQLDNYEIPNACKWAIYKTMADYDEAFGELTRILRPIAARLESILHRFDGLLQQTVQYWTDYFTAHSFAECKQTMMGVTSEQVPDAPQQYAWFWWLGCNQMHYYQNEEREALNIGILVRAGISPKYTPYVQENVVNILKFLSDNSKFEIVRRLSTRSCYGLELANEMQLTSGTISKHLNALFSYGLVDLQRINNRVYYQTDKAAVRRFLAQLEEGLLGTEDAKH